jgi:hypothetical protein
MDLTDPRRRHEYLAAIGVLGGPKRSTPPPPEPKLEGRFTVGDYEIIRGAKAVREAQAERVVRHLATLSDSELLLIGHGVRP